MSPGLSGGATSAEGEPWRPHRHGVVSADHGALIAVAHHGVVSADHGGAISGSTSAADASTRRVNTKGEAVHLTPSQTAALSTDSLDIEDRDALLLEPWTTTEFGTVQEMVKAARAKNRRVNPKTEKPFEVLKLHPKFELEVAIVWFTWMLAATTPLLFVALPFLALILPPVTLTTTFAAAAVLLLLCVYPHRVIELPCAKRITNPLHNRKIGAAFLKYFPLRVVIEDEAVLDSPK